MVRVLFDRRRVCRGRSIRGRYAAGVTSITGTAGTCCRVQRLVLPGGGGHTWTVLGSDHRPVVPAEDYLEYLRAQQVSPNTVKSYARALALWWPVPGAVRPGLGCGDVGELRCVSDVVAHRG